MQPFRAEVELGDDFTAGLVQIRREGPAWVFRAIALRQQDLAGERLSDLSVTLRGIVIFKIPCARPRGVEIV
jgi:hypothetical protein